MAHVRWGARRLRTSERTRRAPLRETPPDERKDAYDPLLPSTSSPHALVPRTFSMRLLPLAAGSVRSCCAARRFPSCLGFVSSFFEGPDVSRRLVRFGGLRRKLGGVFFPSSMANNRTSDSRRRPLARPSKIRFVDVSVKRTPIPRPWGAFSRRVLLLTMQGLRPAPRQRVSASASLP